VILLIPLFVQESLADTKELAEGFNTGTHNIPVNQRTFLSFDKTSGDLLVHLRSSTGAKSFQVYSKRPDDIEFQVVSIAKECEKPHLSMKINNECAFEKIPLENSAVVSLSNSKLYRNRDELNVMCNGTKYKTGNEIGDKEYQWRFDMQIVPKELPKKCAVTLRFEATMVILAKNTFSRQWVNETTTTSVSVTPTTPIHYKSWAWLIILGIIIVIVVVCLVISGVGVFCWYMANEDDGDEDNSEIDIPPTHPIILDDDDGSINTEADVTQYVTEMPVDTTYT